MPVLEQPVTKVEASKPHPLVELRSYVYLDRLQPQFAAFLGTNMRGYLPVVGMASMLIEIAPGVLINKVADAALKAADVRPGLMVVERHFGVLEFHSKAQADVQYSGNAALKVLGLPIEERLKPKILSSQIIHKVNDYHTQIVNVSRLASVLIAGSGHVHPRGCAGWLHHSGRQRSREERQRHPGRLPDLRRGRSLVSGRQGIGRGARRPGR